MIESQISKLCTAMVSLLESLKVVPSKSTFNFYYSNFLDLFTFKSHNVPHFPYCNHVFLRKLKVSFSGQEIGRNGGKVGPFLQNVVSNGFS